MINQSLEVVNPENSLIPSVLNKLSPDNINNLTKEDIRDLLATMESMMQSSDQNQIEIPLKHYFSKDVYAREVIIPKGSLVVGKIHKHTNLNIISKGDISILSIDGILRVQAPYTVVSTPGVKRLVYAHSEVVWTTVHGTDETDIEKIETKFIATNYDEVVECLETKNITEGEKWLG